MAQVNTHVNGTTAHRRIDNFDHADLPYTEEQLRNMVRRIADNVMDHVPLLRWWAIDDRRKMNRPDNVCGYVQRAWDFYWSIRLGIHECNIVLGVGTGGIGAPCMLTTDKYCGTSPNLERYPNPNGYPHMFLDADAAQWPFYDSQFGGVLFNHSFEHLANQQTALEEALRITKPGGCVCILQPCMAFNARGTIDPTHTTEWSADAFIDWVLGTESIEKRCTVVTHNLLDTAFSFETVLRKR
jgi:SAM-dependent methyltransferase